MTILVHYTNCPSTSERVPLIPCPTHTSDSSELVKYNLASSVRHPTYHESTTDQFILALGLHTAEEMETFGFSSYWAKSARDPILRLCHRLIACSIAGRSQAPEKVALGLKRQPDVVVGAPRVGQDALVVDEGDQAIPAPVHTPPPPAAARTMPQRMARLEEDVHEIRRALAEQREVIGAMARDLSRFTI
ncbi:hypothetical protein Tco_1020126 [Tanacetum coccineum]|uniref:Uncharacterized protein n=1 Tax=Tanacetum coccineum TaxID=301880 RepID=A0ABQ5FZ58_9ASTR